MPEPLLAVENLTVQFTLKNRQRLQALSDIHFSVQAGETLGIVGESGCGKSTLARSILQLVPSQQGQIYYQGQAVNLTNTAASQAYRQAIQCVFQDPLDALDPRMNVGESIQEPMRALRSDWDKVFIQQRVNELLQAVGLTSDMRNRYPHEFSGGQCQRIGIARALAVKPELIICDEPVSALDVAIRGQIVQLLADLQQEYGLTLLFISHDLGVVRDLCNRVMVLYLGRVVEIAETQDLYAHPMHPYTQLLLQAMPKADPLQERERLANYQIPQGELPSPLNPPSGCVFHPRCAYAQPLCVEKIPNLCTKNGRQIACHYHL